MHDVRREIRPVPHWLKGWRPWHSHGCHPPTPQRDGHPLSSEVAIFSFRRREGEPLSALSLHLKLLMGMVMRSRIAETLDSD